MPKQLLSPLSHSPHPCDGETTPAHSSEVCEGYTVWILSRRATGRQFPPQPIPFPTSEVLREGNEATRERGHPPCAESPSWEVPTRCGSAVLLLAFLVQLRNVSSPQKHQSEEHFSHIPVLCTTLLVAIANRSTLSYRKPQCFPSVLQDTQLPPVFTSKALLKQTEVAFIWHVNTVSFTPSRKASCKNAQLMRKFRQGCRQL